MVLIDRTLFEAILRQLEERPPAPLTSEQEVVAADLATHLRSKPRTRRAA